MGQLFDELACGWTITTPGRTITESDLMLFAGLTGDYSELHTNEEFAKGTLYGRRIVHGALVFGLSVGLTTRTKALDDSMIAFVRVDNLRFTRPVFIGDTIHVVKKLIAVEPRGAAQGLIGFDTRVVNQNRQTVAAYIDRLLVKRGAAEQANVAAGGGAA